MDSAQETLARLAASVGPLRRVMAAVAARLVETRAHDRLCFARLSDYAREQAGISSRQLQELARVHRALAGLPGLEQVAGSRLAAGDVLEMVVAEAFSAFGLDVSCEASCGSCEASCGSCEASCGSCEASCGSCEASCGETPGPSYRERREPSAHECDDSRAGPRVPGLGSPEAIPQSMPRSIPQEVLALVRGLEEANAHELDRRLRRGIRLEQTLDAAMAPLLRVVTSAGYVWDGDYRSLSAYARDELGMSARKARALLRVERVGDACPALREAYRDGRLSWVKAQCLLPLFLIDLPGDWRRVWVAWAERVTVRRLAADVEQALLLRAGTEFAWRRCQFHPERVQDPIPADEAERERQVCAPPIDLEATQELGFRVPVDVALLFAGVCQVVRARLRGQSGPQSRPPFDAEVFEALLDHARAVWSQRAPGSPRPDPVIERDGYRCAVPGCTSRRNLHDHHVVFRSAGGTDAPDNRVALCAYHHQRGVHAGRMRVRGRAPDGLEFELPTGRYASGDVRLPEDPACSRTAA